MGSEFITWMNNQKKLIESILNEYLPSPESIPNNLSEALRYALLGKGKRIRPLLVIAASEIGDTDPEALKQYIAAVELIHTYSLIHDDLPAMDNDDLRHGKPTCHKIYGEGLALLAGDTLQTLAFEILTQNNHLPAYQNLEAIKQLSSACGFYGMAGGQALDLSNTNRHITLKELTIMHLKKTGALIIASVHLGLLSCHNYRDDVAVDLKQVAEKIGLVFQIIDDILDYESSTEVLGKTAGKDKKYNKPTFVSLLGISAAKQYAHNLTDEAISIAENYLPNSQHLIDIANFILKRNF
ncbi:MAG: geranyl transferase [Neisseriaceae bacterium]|nr:MAG: geranyl transferase [Neisseriaceae bacterium]